MTDSRLGFLFLLAAWTLPAGCSDDGVPLSDGLTGAASTAGGDDDDDDNASASDGETAPVTTATATAPGTMTSAGTESGQSESDSESDTFTSADPSTGSPPASTSDPGSSGPDATATSSESTTGFSGSTDGTSGSGSGSGSGSSSSTFGGDETGPPPDADLLCEFAGDQHRECTGQNGDGFAATCASTFEAADALCHGALVDLFVCVTELDCGEARSPADHCGDAFDARNAAC